MIAMEKMGKNKAVSVDELMDLIFQVKEYRRLYKKLHKEHKLRENWERTNIQMEKEEDNSDRQPSINKKDYLNHIKYIIARNMTRYLNDILKRDTHLPYKQNLLEQLYLPKDQS